MHSGPFYDALSGTMISGFDSEIGNCGNWHGPNLGWVVLEFIFRNHSSQSPIVLVIHGLYVFGSCALKSAAK